ncbi:MAG: N-acetyltransferase [Candidatus Aenigmarchaeota archaeon]|nr:N-acetyltransferase [Candidatus Aenigmarchaeota archaeon]
MDDFQLRGEDMEKEEKKELTGEIVHDETGQKFYIDCGDDEAVLGYTRVNDIMDVHHVFVPESMRGQGTAEKLSLAAFEFAEKNGLRIIATCPYVKDTFLKKHPEWNRIVVEGYL